MSEQVTIKELLELPEKFFEGQSDIVLEATITVAMKPREVKGSTGGRDYHFWSQFVVIKDNTAGIGMDWTMSKAEEALTKGMKVRVDKARTATYEDKDGKTWRKLTKGKVIVLGGSGREKESEKSRDEKKESQVTDNLKTSYYTIFGPNDKVVTHPDILLARQMLITRTAIAKSFIEQGKHLDMHKKECEEWVKWIYGEGIVTAKKESKTKKTKDNPGKKKDKPKEEKKTAKPLSDDVTPIGDEVMGRIGRLYVKAYQKGCFKPKFELADWLNQNWKKKSLLTLSAEELKEAEKELTEMVKGKSKK